MSRSSRDCRRERRNSEKIEQKQQKDFYTLHPKNKNQSLLYEYIEEKKIILATGSAGTGKTLSCLYKAYELLQKGEFDQILYTRPIVDFRGEKGLGYLPGTIEEKVSPLLGAVKDNLSVFMSSGKAEYVLNKKIIDFAPLETLRGRSLRNTFMICDEFQNADNHAVLTTLSRMDATSKIAIIGDLKQKDRLDNSYDGLSEAVRRLGDLPFVGVVEFTNNDICRSGILKTIFSRYQDI